MYLGSVEDQISRRILGFALTDRGPTAELAKAAVNMAIATRGRMVEESFSIPTEALNTTPQRSPKPARVWG